MSSPTLEPPRDEHLLLLTEAQKELWLLSQLDPRASTAYNVSYALELRGAVVPKALGAALQGVLDRHDVLRGRLSADGASLIVTDGLRIELAHADLRHLSAAEQLERLRDEAARGFDLLQAPLLRGWLARTADSVHVLLLVSHHIVVDGASMSTLLHELGELYTAAVTGREAQLAPPPPYARHVEQQRRMRSAPAWREAEQYWRERFRRPAPAVDLPADRLRPPYRSFAGAIESLPLDPSLAEALRAYGSAHGCTLFMTLFAAFSVLVQRLTGQTDIVVGINVSGRAGKASEGLVGYLTRLLPIRVEVTPDTHASAWLERVRDALSGAFEHRQFALGDIVRALDLPRPPGRSPLVDVIFNFDRGVERLVFADLAAELVPVPLAAAKYDVDWNVVESARGLRCDVEYNTDLFRPETIRRFLELWKTLLAALAGTPDGALRALPWLPEEQRRQVVLDWNRTDKPRPREALTELLEAQARRAPDAPAVMQEGVRVSYAELNRRANRLARHLARVGVGREVRVGVCLERGLDWVITILAIWKARGVYVPLDPAYPKDRLAFMLDDAGAAVLVSEEALQSELPPHRARVVCLDSDWEALERESADDLGTPAAPEELAYVIYTSGSTGRPKGAMIEHRGMLNHLWAKVELLGLSERDVVVQNAPASFDVSVWQVFAVLLVGGQVQIVNEDLARDSAQLLGETQRLGATVLETVPTLLAMMVDEQHERGAGRHDLRALRFMISNAEPLPITLCRRFAELYPRVELLNAYGPTECSDDVTHLRVAADLGELKWAPLGERIANMRLYVLDADMQPVPVGVAGELYIGGIGVGRGYHGRPALTAEKYIPDPFCDGAGARLYRTGDQVRFLPDGSCDFIGRIDFQVKLRGLRVELPEIEATLEQHPDVTRAAVIVREDEPGDQRLVGYVVARAGLALDLAALRAHLTQHLPEHMVPSALVVLERMPLTANEKIDRRALPRPEGSRPDLARAYRAPDSPLEKALAAIWSEVLLVERIGVDDSFFELGGHSLLATQVVSRVRKALQVELPLRRLFEAPTIAELAASVARLQRAGAVDTAGPVERAPRDAPLPLSFAQERLWFLQQFEREPALYNMPTVIRIGGRLDADVLEHAITEIVRRHEVLRTRFVATDGVPAQVVDPPRRVELRVVDLQGHAPDELRARAEAQIDAEVRRPFDLEHGPVIRTLLLREGPADHLLLVNTHHIVSDGWSLEVLLQELVSLYEAFAAGAPSPLPELAIQYGDYAVWQRRWLQGDVQQRQLDYWRARLRGVPEQIELPTLGAYPVEPDYRGAQYPFALSPELSAALLELSGRHGVTLFITLLAVFQALLARYSGQLDVVVGSPIAGRMRRESEPLIGFFLNMLVLRTDVSGRPSFAELVARTRDVALGAYANQDLPFERLVEHLRPSRDTSRTPLFQVMFNLQRPWNARLAGTDLTLSEEPFIFPMQRFDLAVDVIEDPRRITGTLRYRADLFDEPMVARMARHYEALLAGVVAEPERPIATLELLSPDERGLVLERWSGPVREHEGATCIHHLFEAQARRTPDAPAVLHAGRELTYAELDRRAEALAGRLRALGVGPDERVGLCVTRGPEMVAGLLGILKAGAAYVPLDPEYPRERLKLMLADARARVLVSESRVRAALPEHTAQVVWLDAPEAPPAPAEGGRTRPARVDAGHAAYVIFTSGSTGRPKGIVLEHRSAVAFLHWACETFLPYGLEATLASTSICFDLSVFEIFAPLACGGVVILAENALELPRLPEKDRVRLINSVPSAVRELLRSSGLPALVRTVNLAGEAVTRALVDDIYRTTAVERVFDLYGPTEDTVYSTFALLARDENDVLIGRPLFNRRAYVLDPELHPAPLGVAGELHLAGAGLARGYLDQPALTAERFVPDPYGSQAGARLYRTGDRARWRVSGQLEYLGRLDHQVKVHGFRIELGEIETALARQEGVREAVVTAVSAGGQTRLVAYVVPSAGELSGTVLRAALKPILPLHMIPTSFVNLPHLPLTANGKLDRKALPPPAELSAPREPRAPRTPIEERLAQIWALALGVERVGVEQDFFALGGHSLLATRVISRVRTELGAEVGLRALFEWPTVAEFAVQVEQALAQGGTQKKALVPVAHADGAPLSYAQGRLLFIHRLQPDSVAYNAPVHLRLTGPLDVERLARCLSEIVRRHEILRTTFPNRDGEPLQHIHPARPVALPLVDLSALPPAARDELARRERQAAALEPFDLAQGPLFRASLLRLGTEEHELLLGMHHVVTDGWSGPILVHELHTLWDAYTDGRPSPLPELPIQYADYAIWQRRWLTREIEDKQLPYWRRQLRDVPVLDLPTDHPRPPTTSHRGAELPLVFSPEQSAALTSWSRGAGVTDFMTLLAAFQWLLSRYALQEDVAVGTVIANRNHGEIEHLVGFFVNTLVLRTRVGGSPSLRELVGRVREVTLGAYAHQDCPFEKLVEELNPQRDLRRSPLFQVRFTLDTPTQPVVQSAHMRVDEIYVQLPEVKFELTMALESGADGSLAGYLVYAADLFERRTVERLASQYRRLVERAVAAPDVPLASIDLLDDDEREEVVTRWNGTSRAVPGRCAHELFEERVARAPHAPALAYEGARLSYAELDARANQLARHLRGMGVGPEVRVGICLGRSLELVVALLGVLKSGGAYVPLDPANPVDRLAFLMEDAQIPVLLTQQRVLEHLPSQWIQTLCLDSDWPAVMAHSAAPIDSGVRADNLAYVIYTSGSTGAPKAVGVEHRQLLNYVVGVSREMGCEPGWRHAYLSSVAADLGNTALFASLCTGGELHVIAEERALDGRRLAAYFHEAGIDCTKITPTHLSGLQPGAELLPARLLVLGGEASSWGWVKELQALRPGCRVMNHYGPTECTVGALVCRLEDVAEPASENVPLGYPLANVTAYLVDDSLRPLPPGMAGELVLGGAGVARGYLGRAESTAERFVPDPFSATPGARLYRTGDKARRLVDGRLEFLGRMDHQVKIRGFRVELGEIEALLRRHPDVGQAAVALHEGGGHKRLVAYVSRRHNEPEEPAHSLYELPNGVTIAQHNPDETNFLYEQIFEALIYLRHGMELPEDACVVDVGANIGMFTLFAGGRCPRGRVYSFEPIETLAYTVRHNARLCAADVKVFPVGISDTEKTAEFVYYPGYTPQSGVRTYAVADLERSFDVETRTCRLRRLSDVIREEHIEYIDFLKIDVQRSEMDVLHGIDDGDWGKIAQSVVFIIRHDTKERTHARVAEVVRLFEQRGFTVVAEQDGELKGGDWTLYARNAAVLARRPTASTDGGTRAKAVVSPELREYLQNHLPEHMLPSVVLVLPQLPLLASGKVARRALPAPDAGLDGARAFSPPRDELETLLCRVWSNVLGVEQVGIHDSFFELGGHSLLGTQVVARLEDELGLEVPLATIFTAPTVSAFAREVARLRSQTQDESEPLLLPLDRDAFVDRSAL